MIFDNFLKIRAFFKCVINEMCSNILFLDPCSIVEFIIGDDLVLAIGAYGVRFFNRLFYFKQSVFFFFQHFIHEFLNAEEYIYT